MYEGKRTRQDVALDELCPDLKLQRGTQDWAIIVADPDRIDEFIRYFVDHPNLSQLARSMLFDLILASINDAMARGDDLKDKLGEYSRFIAAKASDFPAEAAYWRGRPGDSECWPVAVIIPRTHEPHSQ